MLRTMGWVCGFWLATVAVWAQIDDQGFVWSPAHRLVHRFDFEEARLNNFEDLPMYWYAIGRPAITADQGFGRYPIHTELISKPGFPAYTQVGFDRPQDKSGEHRLHLGLNGGNAGAFLEVGAVPAVPHSDYLVTGKIMTGSLRHARARIVAYFIDATGRKIDQSVVASELVQTDGRSQTLSVKLQGQFADAAWIGLQVELLQPQQQPGAVQDPHKVFYVEVDGDAWFDDISIWQLPHVAVGSQNLINVIRAPDRPRLNIQVRDLTARPLRIDVTLYDHRLRPVATNRRQATEWTPVNWKWRPPIKRFGWFLADMVVTESSHSDQNVTSPVRIAHTMASFLWLPHESVMDPQDATRFRIVATDAPEAELDLLPTVMDQAQLASVVISAWDPYTNHRNIDQRQQFLGDVIQKIAGQGRQVVLSLAPIPQSLTQIQGVDSDNPLTLLVADRDVWLPYLRPVTMRHGQRVYHWQLGRSDRALAFFMPELPDLVQLVLNDFRSMTPQPQLVLPWRLDYQRRRDLMPSPVYAVQVPESVMPGQIPSHADAWNQPPSVDYWLHLQEPPATRLAHEQRVEDLTLRMLYGWESQPTGLAINRPWTYAKSRQLSLMPDPLLGVFVQVAHRLAGRRVIGHLPIAPGVQCMIFDGPSGGMLAAWNRSAAQADAVIDMFLGPNPQAVDVWGNRATVPLEDSRHRWRLSSTPVFLEGIDPRLAAFRASFKIVPAFIESMVTQHDRVIQFTNTWPFTITGHLNIKDPRRWDIQPRRHHFSLASGQTTRIGVKLEFPVTETAGPKRLVAHFDFVADKRYTVDVTAGMELGLTNVGFDATLAIVTNPETGKQDAIVTQMISNKSPKAISLYCFAHLVGHRRQEKIIPKLEPGQLVIRRFRFKDAAQTIQNHDIRVGVRESVGPAVFNMVLSGRDQDSR